MNKKEMLNYMNDELLDRLFGFCYARTDDSYEVMILYYIDGLSAAEIAKRQNTSEGAVCQRLFSARQKLKSEVEKMTETYNRSVALDKIDYNIWGTGSPGWGDPRDVCTRMFSKHIVWLCHKKPRSASEIAEELNVPTVYVEEELETLAKGVNGKYGLLRRLDSGKYGINFILFDKDVMEQATAIYTEQLPKICDIICEYIEKHKEEYLAFPYLNKKADLNLILWQQITDMSRAFSTNVEGILAENVCGFTKIHLENIYITRIRKHFDCWMNVSKNPQIQLALRAIDGLEVSSLSEAEKEHAAKAIKCDCLYRDGDVLYTKILVNAWQDGGRLFDISLGLNKGYFEEDAQAVAEKLAALIRKAVPDYLLNEWRFANNLANKPILDAVVESLIEKGILIPPEDGIGAEGCWMSVLS